MKISEEKSARVIKFLENAGIKLTEFNVVTERSHITSKFSMAEVLVNDVVIMTGRYGDFHPGF